MSQFFRGGYRIALALLAASAAWGVRAEPIQIFLLGGQSNMVGIRTDKADLPTALQSPRPDIPFVYYQSKKTNIAPNGLFPGSGNSNVAFGPEVTFGHTVADAQPDTNFALIKGATSNTSLHFDWSLTPDTSGATTRGAAYTAFKQTVTDGLASLVAAGHTPQVVGMLWTQGESDASDNRSTAQYTADLNAFIADIRSNHGDDLPFFLSRLSTSQTNLTTTQRNNIRAAQESVANTDPDAYLIDADGLTTYPTDPVHFNSSGQIALGQRFAASYLATVPEPTSVGLLTACLLPICLAGRR